MMRRRTHVIDELLVAMTRRDAAGVKEILLSHRPTRDEVAAACHLRRLDLLLDAAARGAA